MIRLPWPDPRLSGNGRTDRRYLTAARQQARDAGYWAVKAAGWHFAPIPLQLTLVLHPPDRRRRDDDNIYAAFKSYRDGIFQALELDDSLIRRTVIERGEVEKGGAVNVELRLI